MHASSIQTKVETEDFNHFVQPKKSAFEKISDFLLPRIFRNLLSDNKGCINKTKFARRLKERLLSYGNLDFLLHVPCYEYLVIIV